MTVIPDKFNTLQEVADFLRTMDNSPNAKIGFDMGYSYPSPMTSHPCGSACCIGGWINHINGTNYSLAYAVQQLAMKVGKDISYYEAYELCFVERTEPEVFMSDITPQQAARAIEILLETGKCDWDRAIREVK